MLHGQNALVRMSLLSSLLQRTSTLLYETRRGCIFIMKLSLCYERDNLPISGTHYIFHRAFHILQLSAEFPLQGFQLAIGAQAKNVSPRPFVRNDMAGWNLATFIGPVKAQTLLAGSKI